MRGEEVIAVCSVYIFDNFMNISRALLKIFRLRNVVYSFSTIKRATRLMGQVQLHEHISLVCFQYGFIYRRSH